ncbi:hypothetical protein NL676_013177 [Syzygium grande]|nr:hypothetical protein NL676_013177 [Syzygium grande]
MFGPEGRPQHCCAWLGVASSFPECASPIVAEEYMGILGNFRRRLLSLQKTDNDPNRPPIVKSLLRRHISIVHLAEQHGLMDLTQGILEVLLTEVFARPVSPLHSFEKPAEQRTGSATEAVCNRMMKEHTAALLNCIDASLRSNREILEAVVGSMHSGDGIERDAWLKQIVNKDALIGFCVQAGQALASDRLLAEVARTVLEEGALLIYSLLGGIVKHIPDEIPEKKEIRTGKRGKVHYGRS